MSKLLKPLIISAAMIISAAVINLNDVKALFIHNNNNTMQIDGGSIKLGEVKGETELVDITVYMDKTNNIYFDLSPEAISQFGLKPATPIIHVVNASPSRAQAEFEQQLNDFLIEVNEHKTDKEKITASELMSTTGFAIKITSRIVYDSTLQGRYSLIVEDKESIIDTDKVLLKEVSPVINEIAKKTQVDHRANTFM